MKPNTFRVFLALLLAMAVMSCTKSTTQLASPFGPNGFIPDFSPPPGGCVNGVCPSPSPVACAATPTPFPDGASVALNIDSSANLSDYVGTPLNNPGPVTLHVNLTSHQVTNELGTYKTYGGDLHITFVDDQGSGACAINHKGSFSAGSGGSVYDYYGQGHHSADTKYNTWDPITDFNTKAKALGKFRAFLEDTGSAKPGSLVFEVDTADDTGLMSGSVWFYNFNSTAPHPTDTKCWFVYDGPYDCRDFAVPPTNIYTRLGTFVNMTRGQAFHN